MAENKENSFIPQMEPWFGQEEKDALARYMDAGGWLTEFKNTKEFEDQIASFTGAKHCIVVNNGTISLTIGALACGIGPGDEVIVPNFTMIATPNSIKMIGALPVFVDVEPETLCIDADLIEPAITKKTKAIFLVTANGRYPQKTIEKIMDIANRNGLMVFEDSAQSLGSFYPDGTHEGLKGVWGSFSFSAPKVISTGQGGALITNDDSIADKIRKLKDFGRVSGGNDVHGSIGFNFKFTELQAVIGVEQMKKLPWRVERKKEILRQYLKHLTDVADIVFFKQDLEKTTPWFIDVKAERRDELSAFLKKNGVGTRTMYPPINKQEAYQVPGFHPVSDEIGRKGLWLPSASQLSDGQIEYICQNIKNFYANL